MVRIKHRYLLVHILYPSPPSPTAPTASITSENHTPHHLHFHRPSPNDLTPQLLARAIKDHVQLLYGDYGLGLIVSSLNVKYLSPATSTAIIRVAREYFRIVWGALSFMTQLPTGSKVVAPRECVMCVVRVSGTVRKAEEEAVRRARGAILRARRGEGGLGLLVGGEEEVEERDGGGDDEEGMEGEEEEEDEDEDEEE